MYFGLSSNLLAVARGGSGYGRKVATGNLLAKKLRLFNCIAYCREPAGASCSKVSANGQPRCPEKGLPPVTIKTCYLQQDSGTARASSKASLLGLESENRPGWACDQILHVSRTYPKSPGSNGAVLEGRPAGSRCGDCAKGSIGDWQQAGRGARGLAGIVATGGRSAGAAGDPLGDLAGHPAPPFATADLSVFPSGNHLVRFLVRVPGLADRSGVAGHGSDTGDEFSVTAPNHHPHGRERGRNDRRSRSSDLWCP